MERTIIKQKRLYFILYFFGMLIFVVISLAMVIYHDFIYYRIVGVIGSVFFSFGLFLFGKNCINPKTILEIDEKGIFNLSKHHSMEFIPWSDIEKFSIDRITIANSRNMNNSLISINLKDDNKYIDKAEGIQKKLIVVNKNLGYPVCSINLTGADKKREDVLLILSEYLLKFRERQ